MFVRFFRSSFVIQQVVIVLAGLLLWSRSFFQSPAMPVPGRSVPLYVALYDLLHDLPVVPVLLGFLVMLLTAFLLNNILDRNEIVSKNSSLTGFLFIILTGYHPELLVLNPVGITLFLLVLIISSMFAFYNRPDSLDLVYLAGFLTGTGSLIYTPFFLFFFLILVSLVLFRSLNWRDWLASLIGLLTPFLFLATGYFWFDQLHEKTKEWVTTFSLSAFPTGPFSVSWIALSFILFALALIYWLSSMIHLSEKTIEIRKKTILLNWLPLFALATYFMGTRNGFFHLILFAGSTAILISISVLRLRKSFWHEALLAAFFLIILINNLFINL